MTGALGEATGKRIKQLDTFLLYVLLTIAAIATLSNAVQVGADIVKTLSGSRPVDNHFTFFVSVIALVVFLTVTLHAVFMSVIQLKLNRVRNGIK